MSRTTPVYYQVSMRSFRLRATVLVIDGTYTYWSIVLFYDRSPPVAREPQNTRWVVVSRSNSSAASMGRPPLGQLRVDRMAASSEGGADNGQDRTCAAISVSDPASPLTPRQDLLPVSLLSPSTSSVRKLPSTPHHVWRRLLLSQTSRRVHDLCSIPFVIEK